MKAAHASHGDGTCNKTSHRLYKPEQTSLNDSMPLFLAVYELAIAHKK